MAKTVRKFDKFEYYAEDCRCEYCLYHSAGGCKQRPCVCGDIRRDAIANGRIRRKRGWNKWED